MDRTHNLKESGLFLGGILEQARAQFHETFTKCPEEYLTLIFPDAQQHKDEVTWELEQFMRHIWPTLEAVEPSAA